MLVIKTTVSESKIAGLGLFANEDILKNQLIWFEGNNDPYIKKFPIAEVEKTTGSLNDFLMKYCWIEDDCFCLSLDNDVFTNHSDNPNTYVVDGSVFALNDIAVGEEITSNYKEFNAAKLEF